MGLDERLDQIVTRHRELSNLMSSGDGGDADEFVRMAREFAELEPIVNAIGELRNAQSEAGDLAELIADPETDDEMKSIAQQEFQDLTGLVPELEKKLQVMLLPKDVADDKNAILEVRAGTGGEEAALFAADLLRMYQRYADKHRWKFQIINLSDTGIGGIKEASVEISGRGVFARLKYESGVHRVQRVPETESGGRIHTSAATVAVLPEAEDVDVEINDIDLRIDTYRAQGAGGQHVNTT
ncbi:MAG: PCRF domain-containing protein, partial [Pseudomonadota bacterium]|nr:PCRF domain-containing protein [Pseudomonadota bacterium]